MNQIKFSFFPSKYNFIRPFFYQLALLIFILSKFNNKKQHIVSLILQNLIININKLEHRHFIIKISVQKKYCDLNIALSAISILSIKILIIIASLSSMNYIFVKTIFFIDNINRIINYIPLVINGYSHCDRFSIQSISSHV